MSCCYRESKGPVKNEKANVIKFPLKESEKASQDKCPS